jgi:nitroreductase
MELYEALYTTRAMRRVSTEPIPAEVQARILDAAIRAPSGGNQQNWRFLLVDDQGVKDRLAPLYHDAIGQLWTTLYAPRAAAAAEHPDAEESRSFLSMQRSAQWLADHFAQVPLFLFSFAQHDPTGGSIYPAVWSAMLAARAEGVGTCLTQVLSLFHRDEVLGILGVPADEGWIMSACVSFGYPTGRWGVPARQPVHEVVFANRWGQAFEPAIDDPLWPGTPG